MKNHEGFNSSSKPALQDCVLTDSVLLTNSFVELVKHKG